MNNFQSVVCQRQWKGDFTVNFLIAFHTLYVTLLQKWHSELEEQDHIFKSLSLEVQQAREVGNQLNQLHPDRSPELDRYQEKAQQLTERWSGVCRQMETR